MKKQLPLDNKNSNKKATNMHFFASKRVKNHDTRFSIKTVMVCVKMSSDIAKYSGPLHA